MDTKTALLDLERMAIESGPLAKTHGLFIPNTINTGAQISADRITDEGLRNVWFYTANAALATKRDGKLLLGIGGNAAFNVVFGYNIEQVCQMLKDTGYVHLNQKQRDAILRLEESGNVVFVDPKKLNLQGIEAEYRSFPIRTAKHYKDVTAARVPFVSAGYGSGDMLSRVMANLKEKGKILETVVYTMNPEHVDANVHDDEIVARASGLFRFDGDSRFDAGECDIGNASFGLRGVLKGAEGATPQVQGVLDELILKSLEAGRHFVYEGRLYVPVSRNSGIELK